MQRIPVGFFDWFVKRGASQWQRRLIFERHLLLWLEFVNVRAQRLSFLFAFRVLFSWQCWFDIVDGSAKCIKFAFLVLRFVEVVSRFRDSSLARKCIEFRSGAFAESFESMCT